MALSMMFGAVFGFVAPLIRAPFVGLGATYGLMLWGINFYVLSFVSAGARAMAKNEPLALAVGTHLLFGLALGALVARLASRAQRAA
jgi:hypothetical protein